MLTKVQKFVEDKLALAQYEYDPSVKQWVAWVLGFPGVYAQGADVESVRQELSEVLEEHLLLSLQDKQKIKGFPVIRYAKAH